MKKIKMLGMVSAGLLAVSPLLAQTEKGDWAQFGRYAEANRNVQIPANVVFMGNSITDGWWPADSTFFKENNFVDRGISGQTTSEMLVRFRQDVINLHPKAVVILAGINDIAHNNGVISLENVFGNLVSMAELAKCHDIQVILCSVLPAYDFPWRPGMEPAGKVIRLNEMIKDYADKQGLTYVDYSADFGTPIEYRVGRHLEGAKEIINWANMMLMDPEKEVQATWPGYDELMDKKCGYFLKNPETADSKLVFEI